MIIHNIHDSHTQTVPTTFFSISCKLFQMSSNEYKNDQSQPFIILIAFMLPYCTYNTMLQDGFFAQLNINLFCQTFYNKYKWKSTDFNYYVPQAKLKIEYSPIKQFPLEINTRYEELPILLCTNKKISHFTLWSNLKDLIQDIKMNDFS